MDQVFLEYFKGSKEVFLEYFKGSKEVYWSI